MTREEEKEENTGGDRMHVVERREPGGKVGLARVIVLVYV